jgi:transcriptional regulator
MADDAPEGTPKAPEKPEGHSDPTFTQQQVNDLIAKEKGKIQAKFDGYEDLKAKAARLDELEQANASEIEKAQAKATKAEQAKAEAEAKLTRYEVAAEKQIPAEAMDLLTGSTREELEAKADKLLELVKSRTDSNEEPDFDGGAREPAPDPKTPEAAHNESVLALLGLTPQ